MTSFSFYHQMTNCVQNIKTCWMLLIIYTLGLISLFTFLQYYRIEAAINFQKFSGNDVEGQRKYVGSRKEATNISNIHVASLNHAKVRILCWVMTAPKNHKTKARVVRDTWGRRCNVILFMSSMEEKSIPTIALPVKEGRGNLWAKTNAAFKYIYKHHKSDADWFLKADDDTYIIMENLKFFLHNESLATPVYHGRRLKPWIDQGFMSGGAGYVINRKALDLLVTEGFTNSSICNPKKSKDEDLEVGKCFANLKVEAGDSRDEQGRERFLSYTMEQHIVPGVITAKYKKYFYYRETEGLECCSKYLISFHYISPNMMIVLEYLIYQLRVNPFSRNDTRTRT